MIIRDLENTLQTSKKSILLLGPRQTGKSTLINNLKPDLKFNLANEGVYLDFARNPRELEERLLHLKTKTIFIDEIQRLPTLLNTVQSLIDDNPHYKFYLTGSSARKLKRGHANLLPGRIHTYYLGPLVQSETDLDIKQVLATGSLPGIWTEKNLQERTKTLKSYSATYLKEEIQAEALTKNIEGFSRFLFILAATSGKYTDLTKLSSEAQIPRQTAVRFMEILEDTLVARRCEAFSKSQRKRLIQIPRMFFFDTGVLNGLLNNFSVSSDRIGHLFEHFIFNQLTDMAHSQDKDIRISGYRTEHGAEVDFIIETQKEVIALEVKASHQVHSSDLSGMKSFSDYFGKKCKKIVVYMGYAPKMIDKVEILPWKYFLENIKF